METSEKEVGYDQILQNLAKMRFNYPERYGGLKFGGVYITIHQNDLITGIDTPESLHMESLPRYGVKVTHTSPDGTPSVYGISDIQAENIISRFADEENTRFDDTGIYIDVDVNDFEEPVE